MPTDPSDTEKQIGEQTRRWNDAPLRMDLKVIDSLYADDCIFHFPNGQSQNKACVMNLLSSGNVKFESISNENVRIRVYGNAVLWTSRTALIETYNNQRSAAQYLWLRLWSREENEWRIVPFQSTPVFSPS